MSEKEFKIDGYTVSDDMLPKIEELPESLQTVAEIVGVEKTLELWGRFQGVQVNFTNLSKFRRKIRNAAIIKDYDTGLAVKRIAGKYDLSERQVWSILSGE